MEYYLIVCIAAMFPVLVLAFSGLDVQRGKREKLNWKWTIISFIAFLVIQFAVSIYFKSKYELPIFPNLAETVIVLIIAAVLLVIMIIVSIFVYFFGRGLPTSIHNPKLISVFLVAVPLFMVYICYLAVPLAQKLIYVSTLNEAYTAFENDDSSQEFTVKLLTSEKQCIRASTCRDTDYSNRFFVKNNLNETKEVQIKLQAILNNGETPIVIEDRKSVV